MLQSGRVARIDCTASMKNVTGLLNVRLKARVTLVESVVPAAALTSSDERDSTIRHTSAVKQHVIPDPCCVSRNGESLINSL